MIALCRCAADESTQILKEREVNINRLSIKETSEVRAHQPDRLTHCRYSFIKMLFDQLPIAFSCPRPPLSPPR
jgi:uncharacterized OsmC-like protein